jgi:hypothetical protein
MKVMSKISSLKLANGRTDQKGITYNDEQNGFLILAEFAKMSDDG